MNFKVNLFFHLYETHITPLGIPIPAVPRVSDGVGYGGSYTVKNHSFFFGFSIQ